MASCSKLFFLLVFPRFFPGFSFFPTKLVFFEWFLVVLKWFSVCFHWFCVVFSMGFSGCLCLFSVFVLADLLILILQIPGLPQVAVLFWKPQWRKCPDFVSGIGDFSFCSLRPWD